MIYLLIILFIFIFVLCSVREDFTVRFNDYKLPNFGYCKPAVDDIMFKNGKYDTYCWGQMGFEDCEMLNSNGYNCGKNLETGEVMPCVYKYGKCNDDPVCYSTCYDRVGKCKEPYMIEVESDKLIGLGPVF